MTVLPTIPDPWMVGSVPVMTWIGTVGLATEPAIVVMIGEPEAATTVKVTQVVVALTQTVLDPRGKAVVGVIDHTPAMTEPVPIAVGMAFDRVITAPVAVPVPTIG